MNFINTGIINWLPLALIPLVIYLFFKKRLKTVEFSSLFLLQDLIVKQNRRLQIKNILQLIIRTLIILLLLLLFAGLYFGQEMKHFTEKPTRLFIFLDTSPSMQTNNGNFTLQQQVSTIAKSLKSAFPDAETKLVTSQRNEEYRLDNKADLAIIDHLKPAAGDLTVDQLMTLSDNFFFEDNQKPEQYNNHLFLLTDGKFSTNSGKLPKSLSESKINRFWVTDLSSQTAGTDYSIDSVKLSSLGDDVNLSCYLSADQSAENTPVLLELLGESGKLAENRVEFNQAEVVVNFALSPAEMNQKAYLKIPEDKNSSNNNFYIKIPGRQRVKVLVVGDTISYSYQRIKKMSRVDELQRAYSFTAKPYNSLAQIRLEDYDVIILSALNDLSSYTVSKLNDYQKSGKNLFVLAGSVDPANYNAQIAEKLALPKISGITSSGINNFLPINYVNSQHPLLKNVFASGFKINSAEIYKHLTSIESDADYKKNSREIILASNNQPLFINGKQGTGKNLFLLTSLEKSWSNLAENGLVVPLIINGLRYLTTNTMTRNGAFSSDQSINLGQPDLKITAPDEKEIIADSDGNLPNLQSAGFYRYVYANGQADFFAFNTKRENTETDLTVDSILQQNFKKLSAGNTTSVDKIFGRDSRVATILLILLFILLALEMWLARR